MASARLQSPSFLTNDDELERTRARAARAAFVRRRSILLSPPPSNYHRPIDKGKSFLNHDQIMDLFQNCIKLASENKINQKNTWELKLIDHLSEIVRVRSNDEDNETNFQTASCTLEAGVKIYALRVDSVHSEAYRVLGGINRAGCQADEASGNAKDSHHAKTVRAEESSKKVMDRKMSPLSTLESSYEALNLKKYDVAFTVDPLYHQTSAQFDEGGAKGLLLNNLGVYGGCYVLFDSSEFPEKYILSQTSSDNAEVIDLSFVKDCIDQTMIHVPVNCEISPTLNDILHQFNEDNCRPSNLPVESDEMVEETTNNNDAHSEIEDEAFDNFQSSNFDQYDPESFGHEANSDNFTSKEANYTEHPNVNGEYTIHDRNVDLQFGKLFDFLSAGLRCTSKSNAWAGPDHWKFQKVIGNHCLNSETEQFKKMKIKKEGFDLNFAKSLDKETPTHFAAPKNLRSLFKVNRGPCNTTLPEDCHYRPESLVKLFLLPEVMCFGKKASKCSEEFRREDDYIMSPSLDDDNIGNDHFDFPISNSNNVAEEPGTLVRPQRQVTKVEVKYDKASRQVDIHALKDLLWSNIQNTVPAIYTEKEATVSLKQVLSQFSSSLCQKAISESDISPHLFFICLLHLANEHNLSLHDTPTMDELYIHIPRSVFAG